ncbi:MAG: hypothetical protein AAF553_00490 [Pseudomonadota bacterium]
MKEVLHGLSISTIKNKTYYIFIDNVKSESISETVGWSEEAPFFDRQMSATSGIERLSCGRLEWTWVWPESPPLYARLRAGWGKLALSPYCVRA